MRRGPCRTTVCSRLPPASARPSLPLPAAAEAQRSALYTSHQGAFNQVLILDCCYEERLEVDAINQALRLSPYPHIRDVYNAEGAAFGTSSIGVERRYVSNSGHWPKSVCISSIPQTQG